MNAKRPRSLTSGYCRMLIKQRLSKSVVTCVPTGTPSPHNHEYKCTTLVEAQHLVSCNRTTAAIAALPSKQLPSVACAVASTSPVVPRDSRTWSSRYYRPSVFSICRDLGCSRNWKMLKTAAWRRGPWQDLELERRFEITANFKIGRILKVSRRFVRMDVLSGRRFVRTALDVLSGRHFVRTGLDVLSGPKHLDTI